MIAYFILGIAAVYAAIGLLFAAAFVTWGVERLDHTASGSSWTFRLLLVPGSAVLWPLLASKWFRASKEQHP